MSHTVPTVCDRLGMFPGEAGACSETLAVAEAEPLLAVPDPLWGSVHNPAAKLLRGLSPIRGFQFEIGVP